MLETVLSVTRLCTLYSTFDAFANFIAQEANILQSRTDAHNKNESFKVSNIHGRGGRGRGRVVEVVKMVKITEVVVVIMIVVEVDVVK